MLQLNRHDCGAQCNDDTVTSGRAWQGCSRTAAAGDGALTNDVVALFLLALPIASIAWTVTHEDVFREARDWCVARSRTSRSIGTRKFFYLFTCEYCFSHYVSAFILFITRFTLLYPGWRGYLVAFFSLVWIANFYMSLFGRLRLEIREERAEIAVKETEAKAPSVRRAS